MARGAVGSTWVLSILLVIVSCVSLYALSRCGSSNGCSVHNNYVPMNVGSLMGVEPSKTHRENINTDLSTESRMTGMPTRHAVPINIRTSGAYDTEYTQVGFLSGKDNNIIPLYGRMIMANRNKWQYYTMSDKFHSIRLPISVGGKNASSEYGCDEVSNGDTVYVEGYNAPFRVTLYEKQHLNYIPYL